MSQDWIERNKEQFGVQIIELKKIIENQVSHIVIALDNDAFAQSMKMISKFMDMGIEVKFVKLQDDQDPGELGYVKMSGKINNSETIGFKELMRMKIYGT